MDQNMQAVLLFHNQQATAPNTTNARNAATAAAFAVPVKEPPPPEPAPAPEKEQPNG
jgi:hypothetical protein